MKRLLAVAQSPWLRITFGVAAIGLAVWAIASDWERVSAAYLAMPTSSSVIALGLSFAYVLASLQSWRLVARDLGMFFGIRDSGMVFLVGQMGKYIPGGVWNIVAGAELARDRGATRSRAFAALALSMLISIATGVILASIALLFVPGDTPSWVRAFAIGLPVAAVALVPRFLTKLLDFAFRVTRRTPLDAPVTGRRIAGAAAWSGLSWTFAGLQLWILSVGLGMEATPSTVLLAVGGFAAAWLVGLAVVFVPAGLGAREAVLFPLLAAHLARPDIIVVIVLSRVLFTVADVVLGAIPLIDNRVNRGRRIRKPSSPAA
ncbi:lysylphosphatidylglycerol synthase domain-containing protein [Demequina sp.]|uniref:lysylphosphatidylglycerol synthase transmembrane domain-containing protein n=1 Tax=Demequina sp. TaxID=2050685 RepID=UPI0025BAF91A|nr:lysylphosphatidylglycerol synthase domain-containing protein [Demequina sp.]